jgi:hypothetical protein
MNLRLPLELVAGGRAAALVPALGTDRVDARRPTHPERDARVAVRALAEGRFSRALFLAFRGSDRLRPSTAAVVDALRAVATARPPS